MLKALLLYKRVNRKMRPVSTLLMVLLLAGCASAVDERISIDHMRLGTAAQGRGDWDAARRAYAKAALTTAKADRLLPAGRS